MCVCVLYVVYAVHVNQTTIFFILSLLPILLVGYCASFAFTGQSEDDLAFKEGDIINVTWAEDSGRWYGSVNGHEGWFTGGFVEVCMLACMYYTHYSTHWMYCTHYSTHWMYCTHYSTHWMYCTHYSTHWMYCTHCSTHWMYCTHYSTHWMYCTHYSTHWMYYTHCSTHWMYCTHYSTHWVYCTHYSTHWMYCTHYSTHWMQYVLRH